MMARRKTFPSLSSSRQMMMAWNVSGLSHRPAIIASRPASMRLRSQSRPGVKATQSIPSCARDRLVKQPDDVIAREVEVAHRLRCGIIVAGDDCIAIETDEVFVFRAYHRFNRSRSALADGEPHVQ